MSQICTEETPICRLQSAWGVVNLESGELYRLGGDGAALIWLHRAEAELACERIGDRYTPIAIRVE